MTIRWGIIGCGDVVRKRVAAAIGANRESELRAACRRDSTKLAEFCQKFSVPRAYDDAQSLISAPDVDALYVATPPSLHCPQTIAAASSGKHVLVEKPMAMSVAECDEMIDACGRAGVQLGVAYYRPFYPVVQRMQSIVECRGLGEILSISAVTSAAFRLGPDDDGYWRVIPSLGGGGALMDIGSHRIELFLRLGGSVHEVKAICSTLAGDYRAEDCASMIIQFTSGVHGHLQCYFGTMAELDEFTIVGTRGRLTSSPLNFGRLQVRLENDESEENHPPHANFNVPLIEDFVAAIREDRPPVVGGPEGRAVNEVMGRAYRAATRQPA